MNKVILIGRLGKSPELKYTASGIAVCRFTMATTDTYYDKNKEKKEVTEWHRIVVWGKQGENCHKFIDKGSTVSVEGKIKNESYEKDGETRYTTSIVAQNVIFLDQKKKEVQDRTPSIMPSQTSDTSWPSATPDTNANYTTDDLPF